VNHRPRPLKFLMGEFLMEKMAVAKNPERVWTNVCIWVWPILFFPMRAPMVPPARPPPSAHRPCAWAPWALWGSWDPWAPWPHGVTWINYMRQSTCGKIIGAPRGHLANWNNQKVRNYFMGLPSIKYPYISLVTNTNNKKSAAILAPALARSSSSFGPRSCFSR